MSFEPHVVNMGQVRSTNAREEKRLGLLIRGHAGLEEQKKLKTHHANRECELLRRELAEMYFSAKGQKITKREKWNEKALFEADVNLLLKREKENVKKCKNRRMLNRAKQKDRLMEDLVKDFVSKLENESDSKQSISKLPDETEKTSNQSEGKVIEKVQSEITEVVPLCRSSSDLWEKARNTRFVRTRVARDFEIELSTAEIFCKSIES